MAIHKQNLPPRQEIPVLSPDPAQGLTEAQASQRAEAGWQNLPGKSSGRTEGEILLQHLLTFFNLVFAALAAVLVISGSSVKNMTFLVMVVINTVIGCAQEIRAKRAVERLTLLAQQPVPVCRDGQWQTRPSRELVRDDIVKFASGDQICADAVLRTGSVRVNESLLTGEAVPITKQPGDALLSGSFVVSGSGCAQLTRVGQDSYAAGLASEAKTDRPVGKPEMMRALDRLIQGVGIVLIPIGLALFYQEFFVLKLGLTQSAQSTVAALVGMIPEGLYLLTSIALAASSLKLSRRRVLVQDINSIETLARVDVLCVDKTGTVTEARMEVAEVVPLSDHPPEYLQAVLTAMYGSASPENETGRALQEMFPGETSWQCTHRIPFSSETKWTGMAFAGQGAFLVGAPAAILSAPTEPIALRLRQWTEQGYRVLLVAAHGNALPTGSPVPETVVPLALILLTNRIRPEAPDTFRYFARQGVSLRVISGDDPAAVSQVALRAGIQDAQRYVDAATLETPEDYLRAVEQFTVFGRVTPEQKKLLVQALRQQGHTVAMAGDGVNDVLAMREAHCGIAMASGAQAACQISQLLLLDSDFSTLPDIVAEGRRVMGNIRRAATLFLVKNIFSLVLVLVCFITGWPYPLVPLHLTLISALTIGIPSFFLAMEPNHAPVTGRFLPSVLRKAFPAGLTNVIVVLLAQAFRQVFSLPAGDTATMCAGILGVVGLLILYRVCKPFDRFRRIIWFTSALLTVFCFTALRDFFELQGHSPQTLLLQATLLLLTPTVFLAMQWLFDWAEALLRSQQEKRRARKC